jgi:hypothetical protein
MTETEARMVITCECQDVLHKAQDVAGKLISEAALRNGDNYADTFRDARSILSAYIAELTYYKNG